MQQSVTVAGFASAPLFQQIADGVGKLSDAEKKDIVSKAKAIFVIQLKSKDGKEQQWTLDLKNGPAISLGVPAGVKPDIVMILSDADFSDLSSGKANGQVT